MSDNITKGLVMLLTGGIIYFYFEILVRGYSHISMFLLGGLCFYIVGMVGNLVLMKDMKMIIKLLVIMAFASVLITTLELATGMLVNEYMNLKVWDYSEMKYNYKGQICALYSAIWSLLGLPCVYFYGVIERFVLEEGQT